MIRRGRFILALASVLCLLSSVCGADKLDVETQHRIAETVQDSIRRGQLPGAVVLILHRGEIVYRQAFGQRSLKPTAESMTVDTLFDLASLTKPISTATSIMILAERGKLRLTDRVAQHWPEFGKLGKEQLTIEHLLLHVSGLIADNPESDYADGKDKALERICELKPLTEPGKRFLYSDVNYIVLGVLIERLTGSSLDDFARNNVFGPLGMAETMYRPPENLKPRCAPTQEREGRPMRGEVHDPRAYALEGVAGHAGLFSTADDLAIFARMVLGEGTYRGKRILSEDSVRTMTTARNVPGGMRAYGWDVDTRFSHNRGDLFPAGKSFGHTGFTGTSIWIDPGSQTAVIFLSNRVHPDGKGNINRLRGQVASLAAAALTSYPRHPVLTGIDVLKREKFERLKGQRVGLVTNHTGLDREGRSTIDQLHEAEGVRLVALFSPEHGIRGARDERVQDDKDTKTGLPIYSLYGPRRKPTAELLKDIDTLVFDIQDIGCRFYTYISTLGEAMEAAAENNKRFVVLDRPNPIGGVAVEGPVLDAGRESFVGWHRIPIRHGLTMGELARLYKAERKLGVQLEVVRVEGWRRGDLLDRTGLNWVNPSPNMRCLTAALLYPGVGLLETTNLSVGRGTERQFEWIGAPWLDGGKLAPELNRIGMPGVRFVPMQLTPTASVHKDKACGGVNIIVDDWSRFQPVRTGLAIACELRRLYPDTWQVDRYDALLGHRATLEGLKRGDSWRDLESAWQPELLKWMERRRQFLLYAE
jgi:uncharacterized protein YbbC (DUF1343 family)/CubicO group peptidase (beta-lactamase class C family)